mgnify:CR=1 FL=1
MSALPRFDAYINGQTVEPSGGRYFETVNPYTAKVWAEVARCTAEDANRAVEAAYAQLTTGEWSRLNATQRGALVRKLGQARQEIDALRRGAYLSLYADEDTLVFGRKVGPGDAAIVALTRAKAPVMVEVEVGASLGFAPQKALKDRLGGPGAVVSGLGKAAFTIPARGVVLLAP